MGKHENYVKRTEEFLESIRDELAFEIVDVEFVREGGTWYLRAYCDKEGGIGVEDCADISRRVSDWLDETDFISENYILEVSSPGLGRVLKKDKDFRREKGKKVEGTLYRAENGDRQFTGVLNDFDRDTVTLEPEEGGDLVLERKNIAVIRLYIDF